MKKTLAFLLALVMVFALCACGSSASTASAPAAQESAERTSFIMGIDPEYPPFSYLGTTATTPASTWRSARRSATIWAGTSRSSA